MPTSSCSLASPTCFSIVNVSGLTFERTLQATVAQGLVNRAHGASVYVHGIGQFPGMVGIEWFPGTGCINCAGLRERWLKTILKAQEKRRAVWITFDQLMAQARLLFAGGALWSANETHSLGPVLTACGVHNLLPAYSRASLPASLPVHFDARGRWADATAAAEFVHHQLLSLTNATTLALQAPTNLPFLADAIVSWRLPMVWMADMCREATQNRVLRSIVEDSGHFASPTVQYLGWFNNTHLPNVELLCQCTSTKRLITIASDWSENLSFLAELPRVASEGTPMRQMDDAVVVHGYVPSETYVAVLVSDGDNLAQDWSNLRPNLERRLSLRSRVPISWTVSNRWASDFGGPVLRWFYEAAASSAGYDSFLMGPSGYGYLFPGAIVDERSRREFGARTVEAASALDMQAYVHWDVDQSLDPHSKERTVAAVRMYNATAIRGVFMLGSDPIDDNVGDVVVINKPAIPWGFTNATTAARTLNNLPKGTITYVYSNMKSDPALIDALASQLSPHVRLLGHRELLKVARMKRTQLVPA